MKRAGDYYDNGYRVAVPIVFESGRPKNQIGFDRDPLPVIEVVKHADPEELRRYKEAFLNSAKDLKR